MNPTPLDMWKLSDDLSVLNAAILISDGDPGALLARPIWGLAADKRVTEWDSRLRAARARKAASINIPTPGQSSLKTDPEKLATPREIEAQGKAIKEAIEKEGIARAAVENKIRPAFESLKSALQNDRLQATFVIYPMDADERQFKGLYSELLAMQKNNAPYRFEPDWKKTTVTVDDLKSWLSNKNLFPEFFFPKPDSNSFKNQEHPRYSAELACAVAAWKAIDSALPNKSVRATLEVWVAANAVSFGVESTNGIPGPTAVNRVATLVNWKKEGGATPTGGGESGVSVRSDCSAGSP